ncbi:hypothetical protein BJ912DRAFT_951993 [Pholiota molesta]|nr:hypothetical protein BJ912DRAFT_951993 [Pholiota molesta]
MPDGHIVYAPLALAYPMELTEYPLEEDGYQNEEGAFIQYAERPELSASLSLKGRAPEKPYETFVVYVNNNSRRPSSPPIDSSPCDIKKVDEGGSPSKDLPRVSDPWDLTRLAAFNSRPPKSPTSSSSSYGSAHSTHSRASSFSGTAEGHIPGTNRDVLEFPFGYPIP